mgnify:CR=1 FL=1
MSPDMMELAERAKAIELEYKRKYGRSFGITGELGELYGAALLGLALAERRNQPGYDATDDDDGVKYQVKARCQGVRVGKFKDEPQLEWDQGLFVEMDESLAVVAIWKHGRERIRDLQEIENGKGIRIQRFKEGIEPLWERCQV